MTDIQLFGLIGFAAGAVCGVLAMMPKLIKLLQDNARFSAQDQAFSAIATDALKAAQEQLLTLAHERLQNAQQASSHDLATRQQAIAQMVEPVTKTLATMDEKIQALEKERVGAYSALKTQLESMASDQLRLRNDTASLVQALKTPATRGQWGEMQLKRCLEMAGLQEGVHFTLQTTQRDVDTGSLLRPDALIHLPGGKNLVIDSKVPMAAYLEAFREGITEDEQKTYLAAHARQLREHIRQLSSKGYWQGLESPEFVILFLPGENYFSAALTADPTLLEAGVEHKVIPASPTTLISLCKAVMYGWKQEKLADNARSIAALGQELYRRMASFHGHMTDVGDRLGRAVKSYNDAVGSLERMVLPQARKFRDLGVDAGGKIIDEMDLIEMAPREPVQEKLDENDDSSQSPQQISNLKDAS